MGSSCFAKQGGLLKAPSTSWPTAQRRASSSKRMWCGVPTQPTASAVAVALVTSSMAFGRQIVAAAVQMAGFGSMSRAVQSVHKGSALDQKVFCVVLARTLAFWKVCFQPDGPV